MENIYLLFQQIILNDIPLNHYPWRFIDDPYKILVSEFMLHRTRSQQVIPIYKNFVKRFPSIERFVGGNDEELYSSLLGLGLHWRISNMITAMREIYENYQCVPLNYDELMKIHGIGPYIAGAVLCFSQNKPLPLIDTNTVRVIGRVFGLRLDGEARRRKEIITTISISTPTMNPRKYNYALIDHAHNTCKSRNPDCSICPLMSICKYREIN